MRTNVLKCIIAELLAFEKGEMKKTALEIIPKQLSLIF